MSEGPGRPGPAPEAALRPATPGDVPALRAILAAHGEDGPVPPGRPDIVGPYLAHLVACHQVLAVEEAGGVVAFGATLETGRCRMLTDLFVRPDRVGRGLGRRLLDRLFAGSGARATFASSDPRALPLYVRAGMTPLWPDLYLEGLAGRLPERAPGLRVRSAEAGEAAALELAWSGDARAADHRFWVSLPDADPFVVEAEGEPVAFGIARARQVGDARAVDRLLVRPGEDPVAPAIAGLVRAGRGGPVMATVLGPNPLLPVLLAAGFQIVDSDQFLASDPALVDPTRLLPNPGML